MRGGGSPTLPLLLLHVLALKLALEVVSGASDAAADADFPYTSVTFAAEQVGAGNVSGTYDSPFLAVQVPGYAVRGYSANQISYLVSSGSSVDALLPEPQPLGLNRSSNPADRDFCGSWLNAALPDSRNSSIVHGWYHEEFRCDYQRNSYTNKSIAYAVSHDGGATFVKPGHPNNTIILPPIGNTSTVHQTGEGDHGVLVRDGFFYLYFREWDGFHDGCTVGVARAPVASGGVPGAWLKFYNGAFSQPGLHGSSSMLTGLQETAIRYRPPPHSDYLVAQENGTLGGIALLRSVDGFIFAPALRDPLVPYQYGSWDRNANATELYAYISLVGDTGITNLGSSFYLYYTYLAPGTGFAQRYLARRRVELTPTAGVPAAMFSSLVELAVYYNNASQTCWPTTQMIPNAGAPTSRSPFVRVAAPGGGFLASAAQAGTTQLRECLLDGGRDHMVGLGPVECPVGSHEFQRILGYIVDSAPPPPTTSTPLYRCFNPATNRHSVSFSSNTCPYGGGKVEFQLGFLLQR